MPLSAAERSEINRENASKSTGPRTDEGKRLARRNALKHGLRAEVVALPNEDPGAVAARAEAWNDYYAPQSPAAQHLVNQCVQATLLADRCHAYHAAALSKQVREASHHWQIRQSEDVAALVLLLKTDPATAARRLTETAAGCRHLVERWEALDQALIDHGAWTTLERDEAIRLQGFNPDPDTLRDNPEAWLTRLLTLLAHAAPNETALNFLFEPRRLPDRFRSKYRPDRVPDRQTCRDNLREMIADALAPLRALETELRTLHETPDLAEVSARALILADSPSVRLFLRYHAESRTAFHRAYNSLIKTLELDASSASCPDPSPVPLPVSPNEPKPAPVDSPNEPKAPPDPPSQSSYVAEIPPFTSFPAPSSSTPIAPPVVAACRCKVLTP